HAPTNVKDATLRQTNSVGCTAAVFASAIVMAFFALTVLPALAAATSGSAAGKNPRVASLQIEIWPEYDRPAALVILKGELAPDVALPAAVSLRIAASSGGPGAVAYSTAEKSNLLNLQYERADAGEFIALRFIVPERFFHVEFYDRIGTDTSDRQYTYVWPGDMTVDRMTVILQEPAAATNLTVQPNLDATASDPDGLHYRSAELGAVKVGKQVPIEIRYTKTDPRTSVEIVKPKPTASTPLEAARPSDAPAGWVVGLGAAVALALIAVGAVLWWSRRETSSGTRSSGGSLCPKCGSPFRRDDRFCSKCGTPRKQLSPK
ncbi:MAG TPA: zinc ribbon domain-containing protein, partial [Burkholderiales bacterium]|nr:zinc ribbon domain-containing protein [Burkholderiales bacterium]